MTKHKLVPTAIQWPHFKHGYETWILWRCQCGCTHKRRVEKIDGQWTLKQLGYTISEPA